MTPRELFKGYAPVIARTECKERKKVVILTDDDLSRSKLPCRRQKLSLAVCP